MKQIRQKIFETNSSSTHSIVLCEDDKLTLPKAWLKEKYNKDAADKYDIADEWGYSLCGCHYDKLARVYYVDGEEYGWDQFACLGFDDKLSYIVSKYGYDYDDGCVPVPLKTRLEKLIKEKYPECEEIVWGKNIPDDDNNDRWLVSGYIDHQSADNIDEIVEIGVEEFLTNDRYVILGGNDNSWF